MVCAPGVRQSHSLATQSVPLFLFMGDLGCGLVVRHQSLPTSIKKISIWALISYVTVGEYVPWCLSSYLQYVHCLFHRTMIVGKETSVGKG